MIVFYKMYKLYTVYFTQTAALFKIQNLQFTWALQSSRDE